MPDGVEVLLVVDGATAREHGTEFA